MNLYDDIIAEASRTYGVEPELIKAMIAVESGGKPTAVSSKKAKGLMQLMPGTAKEMGVVDVTNPRQNIMGGTKYYSQQLKATGGDVPLALASYNAGPKNVKKYGGIPPFPETQGYVSKVQSKYDELKGLKKAAGPFEAWQQDPEFNALSESEKAKVYLNYFDKEMADDEFNGLPFPEQKQVKSNFLKSVGGLDYERAIPATVKQATEKFPGYGPDVMPPDAAPGAFEDRAPAMETPAVVPKVATPVPQYGYSPYPVDAAPGVFEERPAAPAAPSRQPDIQEPIYTELGLPVGEPRVLGQAVDVPFKPGRAIAKSPGAFTEADPFSIERKEASISDIGGQIGRKILQELYDAPGPKKIHFKEGEMKPGDMGEQLGRMVAEIGVEIPVANVLIGTLAGSIGTTAKAIRESTAWRKMTIPERRLVVQSLDDVIRNNPNMTEGQIAKRWDNLKQEMLARRAKTEKQPSWEAKPEPPDIGVAPEPPKGPKPPAPKGEAKLISETKKIPYEPPDVKSSRPPIRPPYTEPSGPVIEMGEKPIPKAKEPEKVEGAKPQEVAEDVSKVAEEKAPQEAAAGIKITGDKDKTVSVEMPEKKADALTPKQQKSYLIEEIDKAIETASSGVPESPPKLSKYEKETLTGLKEHKEKSKKIYKENLEKFGTVTIEVPGDGEFTILNTKDSLSRFKKASKSWPVSILKPKFGKQASTKPTGQRVTGFAGEYYRDFIPRKHGIIERSPDAGVTKQYFVDGYFTDGNYVLKINDKFPKFKKPIIKKKEDAPSLDVVFKQAKEAKPAIISSEYYISPEFEEGTRPLVHAATKDGTHHYPYRDQYIDSILTAHPEAKPFINKKNGLLAFKDKNDKVVGAVMPMATGDYRSAGSFEELPEETKKRYIDKFGVPKAKPKASEPLETDKLKPEEILASKKGKPIKQTSKPVQPTESKLPDRKRHDQLLGIISKHLELPIRVGKFRRPGATGIYKTRAQVVRIKKANDIPTAMHEVGHHIQELLGLTGRMPDKVRAMAYEGATDLNKEGFAEFVRYYVTEPDYAKTNASEFYKTFEDALKNQTKLQDIFVEIRTAWQTFQSSPAVQKVGSFVAKGEKKQNRISFNKVYTKAKDNLWPIHEAVKMAQNKGHAFRPSQDPYVLARATRGWLRKADQYLKYGTAQLDPEKGVVFTGPPLKEILAPIEKNGNMELFDIYLISKRAVTDPKNRIIKGFDGILSKSDFEKSVKELEPIFEDAGKKLQKYQDELLKYLKDSGRIGQDLYNRIKANNPFYAPLYRIVDDGPLSKRLGQKSGSLFNPIKKLKGSSRTIYSPVESLLYNTYTTINAAERARIGTAMIRLSKLEGMGNIIEQIPFPIRPDKVKKEDFLKILADYGEWSEVRSVRESETITSNSLNPLGRTETPNDKMINVAKEALKSRGWTDAEATQIINRIKDTKIKDRQEIIEKTIDKTTIMTITNKLGFGDMPEEVISTFRPVYRTGPNEVIFYENGKPKLFEIGDPDLFEALINVNPSDLNSVIKFMSYPAKWLRAGATTFAPEFGIRNPFRDQGTAFMQTEYGYKPGIDLLRGLFHVLGQTEKWQKFNMSGAAHASIVSIDRNYLSKNLKQLFKQPWKGMVTNPLNFVQAVSEIMEEVTRVGEFSKALKKEGESLDALLTGGMAAREVALDFMRIGGTTARAFNMISAFWNARLEGIDKMIRTHKKHPLKVPLKGVLAITLPSLLIWYAQKDDPYYNELPPWRRVLFWNFVFHNDDGSLKYVLSFPKPFEWGLIYGTIPEMAAEWAYTKDPHGFKKTVEQIGKTLDIFPMPTGAVPLIEWFANKSIFFDRPIVPRGKEELEPVLQAKPGTSETTKLIAEMMDKIPGLKKVANPAKLENLLLGYTAGLGKMGLQAGDWMIETFGVADIPPAPSMKYSELPGVRALFHKFPSSNTKSIEQFYNEYLRIKRIYESGKERAGLRGTLLSEVLRKKGVSQKPPKELQRYEATAKTLTLFRKQADFVYKAKNIEPKKKREMLDNIYVCMMNVARSALGKEMIRHTKQGESK